MGFIYAFLAALSNSTIGVVSHLGFDTLSFYQIAFFKSLFSFLFISCIVLLNKECLNEVRRLYYRKKDLLILSFFGVFILYFFETKAFSYSSVAIVSFTVYSMGVSTLFFSYFILNEKPTKKIILAICFVLIGVYLIIGKVSLDNLKGVKYAMLGGIGYSLFIVLCKKTKLIANIGFLWWLMGFGTLFLSIPYFLNIEDLSIPTTHITYLIFLSIVPTIGGFYFTSKALALLSANRVQIIEMCDPFLASILAYIILGDIMNIYEIIGGIIIFLGLTFL